MLLSSWETREIFLKVVLVGKKQTKNGSKKGNKKGPKLPSRSKDQLEDCILLVKAMLM